MNAQDAVVLIPGFFGFATFGEEGSAGRIEYFDRVIDALSAKTGLPRTRFFVHRPPPTGALWRRVRTLHDLVAGLLSGSGEGTSGGITDGIAVRNVHLVGHSTGGVDAWLLRHPGFAIPGVSQEQRQRVQARIGSVTTLSAPLLGTPLARRLRGAMEWLVPSLFLITIMTRARRTLVRDKLVFAYSSVRTLLTKRPPHAALRLLGGMSSEVADQVRDFLDDIIEDHTCIHELTPAAMKRLLDALGTPVLSDVHHYVSVAPPPRIGITGFVPFLDFYPVRRVLYTVAYWTATTRKEERLAFPIGVWVQKARTTLGRPDANDGVVPSGSQVIPGATAAGIVAGDHFDVIGHFDTPEHRGDNLFRSGAGFDDTLFDVLWTSIATRILEAAGIEPNRRVGRAEFAA